MRQLLVINPNTSPGMTALLRQHVQQASGSHVVVTAVTARFGAPYIADEASYAVAGHATLDAWAAALAQAAQPPDAVLIGCFGDPGLMALRESSPVPVTGLAEAAFIEAARHGRFAIVTGGERWAPILQRLAQSLGHASGLAGIHTVAPTGAQLAADPIAARRLLTQACLDAVRQLGVQTVILGGAGLAGMAAGTHWALRSHVTPPQRATPGFDVPWVNLSTELTGMGLR